MPEIKCRYYGFECSFVADGETEKVIEDFRNHAENEHGIDYSVEAVKQILIRKQK